MLEPKKPGEVGDGTDGAKTGTDQQSATQQKSLKEGATEGTDTKTETK